MKVPSRKEIDALRNQYPPGSRITLNHMNDPYHPVEPGTTSTLVSIDDMGTVHVTWDNGRTLGLIFGEDSFDINAPVSKDKQDNLSTQIRQAEEKKSSASLSATAHYEKIER